MIKFKVFLVFLLSTILVGLVSVQTIFNFDQQYQDSLDILQQIDRDSVLLNEQLLKTHQGLLRNYDGVITITDALQENILTIEQKLEQNGQQNQRNDLAALKQIITELSSSTEYFLSVNSILNNSLAYLPVLISRPLKIHI